MTASRHGEAARKGRWSSLCSPQLNALLGGLHTGTETTMRRKPMAAMHCAGAHRRLCGRLKLGVGAGARAEALSDGHDK